MLSLSCSRLRLPWKATPITPPSKTFSRRWIYYGAGAIGIAACVAVSMQFFERQALPITPPSSGLTSLRMMELAVVSSFLARCSSPPPGMIFSKQVCASTLYATLKGHLSDLIEKVGSVGLSALGVTTSVVMRKWMTALSEPDTAHPPLPSAHPKDAETPKDGSVTPECRSSPASLHTDSPGGELHMEDLLSEVSPDCRAPTPAPCTHSLIVTNTSESEIIIPVPKDASLLDKRTDAVLVRPREALEFYCLPGNTTVYYQGVSAKDEPQLFDNESSINQPGLVLAWDPQLQWREFAVQREVSENTVSKPLEDDSASRELNQHEWF